MSDDAQTPNPSSGAAFFAKLALLIGGLMLLAWGLMAASDWLMRL